jgi:hypothetical protein
MNTYLTDRNGKNLSELAYLADRLGRIGTTQFANLDKVFFENDGTTIKPDIAADEKLKEFAEKMLANNADYSDILNNYKLVDTANDQSTGYKALAVMDLRDKSVTVANAGTDGIDWEDIGDDWQMVKNEIPEQIGSAKNFVNDLMTGSQGKTPAITDNTIINFTGHSLGGALAQMLTVEFYEDRIIEYELPSGTSVMYFSNIGAVKTFEAYGTEEIVESSLLASKYSNNKSAINNQITNFVHPLDPVANVSIQIGSVIDITNPNGGEYKNIFYSLKNMGDIDTLGYRIVSAFTYAFTEHPLKCNYDTRLSSFLSFFKFLIVSNYRMKL